MSPGRVRGRLGLPGSGQGAGSVPLPRPAPVLLGSATQPAGSPEELELLLAGCVCEAGV